MNKPVLPNETAAADAPPPAGHNNPPPYDVEAFAALTATADEFLEAADIWRKQEVTSDELAGQLTDMISGLRKNLKAVDEARKAAKKPHDDAGKAVQAAFTPLADRYDRALKVLLAKAAAWIAKKQAEEYERRAKAKAEADALEAEAKMKAMEAEASGNIDAQLEAEAAAKEAAKAQKVAAKETKVNIGSASGAGRTVSTRTRRVVTIVNQNRLYLHLQNDERVGDFLHSLATAEANSKDFAGEIPGCEIQEKQVAV